MIASQLQLKNYQLHSLNAFRDYMVACNGIKPKTAFIEATDLPYQFAPLLDEGMPYVCLRIPTGGGKTIVAAHSIGIAAQEYLHSTNPMVLWLVPSDAILQQTIKALKNINHPYRGALAQTFGNNVCILSKAEALQMSRPDAEGNACIIVATIQSFRRQTIRKRPNPEGLKVYEDSGHLMPHFSGLSQDQLEKLDKKQDTNIPIASLCNLLKLHRPMVIVDEAHNARSSLSFETLNRFNPSLILELTATPQLEHAPEKGKHRSNVLYSVSASELKAEHMIKMPIRLETDPDWKRAVTNAIDRRNQLETAARQEGEESGEYIRPVVLFQAQSARKHGPDRITFDVLETYLKEEFGASDEQIAVHTGERKELDGLDVSHPNCPVLYIITVQKLREGWDCPFAYILCSLEEQSAATSVEQLLGRVLRMPKATRKKNDDLNMAYSYVASSNFSATASKLKDGLVEGAGFNPLEVQHLISEQGNFGLKGGRGGPKSETVELSEAKSEPFDVPLMAFNRNGELELFCQDHFLNLPWPLHECDAKGILEYFSKADMTPVGSLDIDDTSKRFVVQLQHELALVSQEPNWDVPRLVNWLDNRITHPDVTKPSAIVFLTQAIEALLADGQSIGELAMHKFQLRDQLKLFIAHMRREREGGQYDALFDHHADKLSVSSEISVSFDPLNYPVNKIFDNSHKFKKHFSPLVGDFDTKEELECAIYLDGLREVKVWARNLIKQPCSFWLQLPQSKFYPDFVARLTNGDFLVVEYKGADRFTADDAKRKRMIGNHWAELGGDTCHFCMPTDKKYETIRQTIAPRFASNVGTAK